jgi:thiamine-phosphate diphosphorylase
VNDHLDAAIDLHAYGVHLGQEDLQRVGRAAIERAIAAGLRIGVSTHSYAELARAIAIRPSYVALGPVYPTTLKAMRYAPQGPERLAEWQRLCAHPLVAIGGITLARVAELDEAAGISIVGDLHVGGDVEARARSYLAAYARS